MNETRSWSDVHRQLTRGNVASAMMTGFVCSLFGACELLEDGTWITVLTVVGCRGSKLGFQAQGRLLGASVSADQGRSHLQAVSTLVVWVRGSEVGGPLLMVGVALDVLLDR